MGPFVLLGPFDNFISRPVFLSSEIYSRLEFLRTVNYWIQLQKLFCWFIPDEGAVGAFSNSNNPIGVRVLS